MAQKLEMNLPAVDSLFSTQEEREEARFEKVLIVSAGEVHPYERQPYSINRLTGDLIRLMDSIGQRGIEEPLIVRPRKEGGYEIISGHRRNYCGEAHNIPDRPIIVRDYSDDDADILVADFNIAREKILASERAKAYKLRYDAMKRQGQRTDLTSGGFDQKLNGKNSRKELAEIVGMTEREVRNYLNINKLIPEILQMVDEEKIAISPASDLSSLSADEQRALYGVIEAYECTPSTAQATKMRLLSKNGELKEENILSIMSTEKPNQSEQFKIPMEKISKFFPDGTTKEKIHETIIKALELLRQKERARDNDAR